MELDRNAVVQSFVAESEDGFSAIESALLRLEKDSAPHELVAEIFRVVHTLKGNALLLGFEPLAKFAHEVEDVLHRLRAKQLAITSEVISLLLTCNDALRIGVAESVAGKSVPAHEQISRRLSALASGNKAEDAVEAGESVEATTNSANPAGAGTLRVSLEKLDQLLDLTGEISIARGRERQLLSNAASGDFQRVLDAHEDVDRLFLELQRTIMRARMVPLGPVFQNCSRAVRDLAGKLGKQAELITSGEDVEVDTRVTELIRDPLVHIVRNAIDHGIESPDERRAAGKHPRGRLELSAEYQGTSVVIEFRDDGRGIDVSAVREKARAEGLLGEAEAAGDQELFRLLFRGGFSTAAEVSDVSGRGVGLEVVRRNIEALRGHVHISSIVGEGTTIRIRLPLTVAVLEGFLVDVGGETYVTPLDAAVECLELPAEYVAGQNGSAVIDFRGSPLPMLRLRNVFNVPAQPTGREKVLVIRHHDALAGFIVDDFHGQRQVVIKSLGRLTPLTYGISGSTILGDGRVALLLDVPRLMDDAVELTRGRV